MTRMIGHMRGNEHGPEGPGRFERVEDEERGEVPLDGGPDERTRIRVKYTENSRSINWELTYEVVVPGLMDDKDYARFHEDTKRLAFGAIDNIPAIRQHRLEVEEEAKRVAVASQVREGEDSGG